MLNDPGGNQQSYRPLQAYGDLNVYLHDTYANYHGLQALLSRQRGNFNFTASYTFSKFLGVRTSEIGNSWGSEYIVPVQGALLRRHGSGPHARGERSFSWLLHEFKDNAALNAILGGWQLAGVGDLRQRCAAPVGERRATSTSRARTRRA